MADFSPAKMMRPDIPGYDIGELLGEGAMGSVFRARDLTVGRDVAIKWFPSAQATEASVRRFEREAGIAAGLRHPNLVTIYTAGHVRHGQFLVMELVEGLPLSSLFERKALGPAALANTLAKVADGLQQAHDAGVVHRDLKPSNILIDARGEPRVVDFGVAAHLRSQGQITAEGNPVGTILYMAPEVLEQGSTHASPASDVYSLSVTLYEGLAGKNPFTVPQATFNVTVSGIVEGRAPALPEGIDAELAASVRRGMSVDPSQRPSAKELAAALRAPFGIEPPAPTPQPAPPTADKVRLLQALLAALGVLLAGMLVVLALRDSELTERREQIAELEQQVRASAEEATRLKEALQATQASTKTHGDYRYQMGVGQAYVVQRNWPNALKAYEQALELAPGDIVATFQIGLCHHNAGALPQARAAFERVIATTRQDRDGHFYRGCAYQRMGKAKEAIASYTRALALLPDDASAHINRGEVLLMTGDLPAARSDFEEALALLPDSPRVKRLLAQVEAAQRRGGRR